MRKIRVFIDLPLDGIIETALPEAPAHHLLRVLRLRPGARVHLFDGSGLEYPAQILAAGQRGECRVRLDPPTTPRVESNLAITLFQSVARGDRMDWCIQKATELGVARIQPVISDRTEVRLDAKRAEKRRQHWQQVAVSAAEQSGRVRIPAVALPADLADLSTDATLKLFLDPRAETGMTELQVAPDRNCALVIGPEGGLSDAEVGRLRARGFNGLRLGPRVLRTETAGPVAIAVLQARFGDLS